MPRGYDAQHNMAARKAFEKRPPITLNFRFVRLAKRLFNPCLFDAAACQLKFGVIVVANHRASVIVLSWRDLPAISIRMAPCPSIQEVASVAWIERSEIQDDARRVFVPDFAALNPGYNRCNL
jgi:hypothetical protein